MKRFFCLVAILLIANCLTDQGWSLSKRVPLDPGFAAQPYYWYERDAKKQARMALDEVAVFPSKGKAANLSGDLWVKGIHPQAEITERNDFIIFLKLPEPLKERQILEKSAAVKSLNGVQQASPVFYTTTQRTPDSRLVLTGEIIVQFPKDLAESDILAIEKNYGLKRNRSVAFAANTFLYQAGDPLQSLAVANDLYESGTVNYAYPNWYRRRTKRALPDDPLFNSQWHLNNTGQSSGTAGEDVDIASVWETYKGSSNEVIAVVDDGLEINHVDLKDNVLADRCWDYIGNDLDPTHTAVVEGHGTNVAGVAVGRGFNGQGITGAAPWARMVGYRLLGAETDFTEADALTRDNEVVDIYSNSWGVPDYTPPDGVVSLAGPGPLVEDALVSGTSIGRGGFGSIFVWAGGNGFDEDNSNYDGYANSRYTIAVAASTNKGKRAVYSERGANIMVNAPSGDILPGDGTLAITTTARNNTYRFDFNGTSAATPLVSGIIALMLEANPNLTWRDVQHILIQTAEQNDPLDGDWVLNGAGYPINHQYGFGRIDAQAAVDAARTWVFVGTGTSVQSSASPQIPIPDNDTTGVSDTIFIALEVHIEFVEVTFSAADHTYWGDLEITLTSPAGTESVLAEKHLNIAENDTYINWRFGSVRHFGEASQGNWTLRVKDLEAIDTGTFQSWALKIYGIGNSLDSALIATQVARYYNDILDRSPDTTGAAGWQVEILRMVDLAVDIKEGFAALAKFFFNSPEYLSREKNNSQYVTDLYQTFFDRAPDQGGQDFWVGSLEQGISRNVILNYFVYGDEFQLSMANIFEEGAPDPVSNLVNDFYRGLQGRLPDTNGFIGWTSLMRNAKANGAQAVRDLSQQIALSFLQSEEYILRNKSDIEFLEDLYNGILRRGAQKEEFDGWLDLIQAGMTREEVLKEFTNSPEFQFRVQEIIDAE
ncbi:MAG: DUF4214 domain-containing protein [Desulfobacterales bacterium]|nr:MAG: DUF4214 domain-containing protein [Desulfobacterales bacterium]